LTVENEQKQKIAIRIDLTGHFAAKFTMIKEVIGMRESTGNAALRQMINDLFTAKFPDSIEFYDKVYQNLLEDDSIPEGINATQEDIEEFTKTVDDLVANENDESTGLDDDEEYEYVEVEEDDEDDDE